jgi:hypothetical protein
MALSNAANDAGAAVTATLGGLLAAGAGRPAGPAPGAITALGAVAALHRLSGTPPRPVTQPVPRRTSTGSQGTVDPGH